METAFSLEHISIGFDGIPVLRDVDFSLRCGEIHAIAGKNGAGKSTLMKILTGVYKPDAGKITIFGRQMEQGQASSALQEGVAMVYQDLSLIPSMSVTQNIFLKSHPFRFGFGAARGATPAGQAKVAGSCYARPAWFTSAAPARVGATQALGATPKNLKTPKKTWGLLCDSKARDAVREIFALMGGIDFISPDALVSALSTGEAQLVEIAKALAGKPRIVVLDEPTAALSDIETAQLFATMQTLKKQGISMIYISHYLEDVMRICDRITVLRDGRAVLSRRTSETSITEIIEHMLEPGGAAERPKHQHIQRQQVQSHKGQSGDIQPLLTMTEARSERVGPITLKAYPKEIIGLAGLLGSGRSEIFRLLFGLDKLRSGEICIQGQQVVLSGPKSAIEHGISLVPEERRSQGLVLDFPLAHNISLSILKKLRQNFLLNRKREHSLAEHARTDLQIKARSILQAVRYLSGGNQQKVVFGKCLFAQPRILLLDDPTFGVDVHAKSEIMKIIAGFAASGNTVLLSSSEFGELAGFCDRIYIVKKRQIAEEIHSADEATLLRKVQ